MLPCIWCSDDMLMPRGDVTVVWWGVRCWWVCLSGSAHRRERLPWLAGEGACPSGRPRNRLFSNVQLPIIPAVINHPTLTNEVEQSASQSATQHTTTHSPPALLSRPLLLLSFWYHSYLILNALLCSVLVVWSRIGNFGSEIFFLPQSLGN